MQKKVREYLPENENIFENILACESRDQVLLIHEKKTRGQKSHATVPLSPTFEYHSEHSGINSCVPKAKGRTNNENILNWFQKWNTN